MNTSSCPYCKAQLDSTGASASAGLPFCSQCGWNAGRIFLATRGLSKDAVIVFAFTGSIIVIVSLLDRRTFTNAIAIFLCLAIAFILHERGRRLQRKKVEMFIANFGHELTVRRAPDLPQPSEEALKEFERLQSMAMPRRVRPSFMVSSSLWAIRLVLAFPTYMVVHDLIWPERAIGRVVNRPFDTFLLCLLVVVWMMVPKVLLKSSQVAILRTGTVALARVIDWEFRGTVIPPRITFEFESLQGERIRANADDISRQLFEGQHAVVFYDPDKPKRSIVFNPAEFVL